jgi:hypothetical protein
MSECVSELSRIHPALCVRFSSGKKQHLSAARETRPRKLPHTAASLVFEQCSLRTVCRVVERTLFIDVRQAPAPA